MKTNCTNCGATINPHFSRCECCGTPCDIKSAEKIIKDMIKEYERRKNSH